MNQMFANVEDSLDRRTGAVHLGVMIRVSVRVRVRVRARLDRRTGAVHLWVRVCIRVEVTIWITDPSPKQSNSNRNLVSD